MADQLNADGFVRQVNGEGLVTDKRVASALRTILETCGNAHGFIANCARPAGDTVAIGRHTAGQSNWPWSGVEYALAAHLVLTGRERDGVRIAATSGIATSEWGCVSTTSNAADTTTVS